MQVEILKIFPYRDYLNSNYHTIKIVTYIFIVTTPSLEVMFTLSVLSQVLKPAISAAGEGSNVHLEFFIR